MSLKDLFKKKSPKKENMHLNYQLDSQSLDDMDEAKIKELFHDCADVKIERYYFGESNHARSVIFVYCEGICDTKKISSEILPKLEDLFEKTQFKDQTAIKKWRNLPINSIQEGEGVKSIVLNTFEGKLVVWFEHLHAFYTIDIANPPQRTPEEPNTEVSVRGPRDGFVEDINVNIALVRKRLRTGTLAVENFVLGVRSGTRISLLYMKDIVDMKFIEEVRQRLHKINIDKVVSSTELEEIITDSSLSIFPLLDYTGRPDYAVQSLLRGRFVLIVDGSPTVSIAPVNLLLLVKAPEDVHFNFIYVSFARVLRIIGLSISLLLPGFYVALISYHQDQIPFLLLATIANSRMGIPLSPPLEILLVLVLYELFREAGVRLPKAVGQTLTVVGGLIIGDAAIRAGLTSPSMVVIASLIAVSKYTLVNQIVSGTVTIISFVILFSSMLLGLFGFFISSFAILLHLANLKSFGLPYLAPIAPIRIKEILPSIFMLPWKMLSKRPEITKTKDRTRQGDQV